MSEHSPALRRRSALVPAVTAAAVGGFLALEALIGTMFGILAALVQGQSGSFWFEPWWLVSGTLGAAIPVAAGVFLSLWLLAPITAGLPLTQVLIRSGVAAAVGAVMRVLFTLPAQPWTGPFGVSMNPALGLFDALMAFLTLLPLVLLAGVLCWLRERRRSAVAAGSVATEPV